MRKIFLLCISVLVLLTSCHKAPEAGIQTGDLVFVALPAGYHLYNKDYVGSSYRPDSYEELFIHAAIADVDEQGVWIIDATIAHGVDRHPLDVMLEDFALKDGYGCSYIVMRLKNNRKAKQYVANAKKFLGKSYNTNFTPCDTALYCTELIRESYVSRSGKHVFPEYPIDFRDREGTMPDYWTWLFGLLGKEVPQGVIGTTPQGMLLDPQLVYVDCQLTDYAGLLVEEPEIETCFTAIRKYMIETIGSNYDKSDASIPFNTYIAVDESNADDIQVWGDFWLLNYNQVGDTLKMVSGGNYPGKMHVRQIGDTHFEVTSFEPVGDGSNFTPTAKKIFGDKYDAFVAAQADDNKREALRKDSVIEYVRRNNLQVKFYQDYGWPAVSIANN